MKRGKWHLEPTLEMVEMNTLKDMHGKDSGSGTKRLD